VLPRLAAYWHRAIRYVSRTEWLIRVLGLRRSSAADERPGLVIVQIDGLSYRQLRRALARGRMPFLRRLLRRHGHRLHPLYSGLPSATPAMQGELFYGVRTPVPAFSFYDPGFGRVVRMHDPQVAAYVENELEKRGQPLLKGGTAYMDVYTGGAEEPHFCPSQFHLSHLLGRKGSGAFALALILHPLSLLRVAAVFGLEVMLALVDCMRGVIDGRDLWKELRFVPVRVSICIVARELITLGARMDVVRGFPVVHVNLVGYDEQAHRRGPSSKFAHWTLGGIDRAIERIWQKARHAPAREYDLCVYSDHGQEDVVPYPTLTGTTLLTAVRRVFTDRAREASVPPAEARGIQTQRLWAFGRSRPARAESGHMLLHDQTEPIVTAMGPLGHVYWPGQLEPPERCRVARALVAQAHVPLVLFTDGPERVRACSSAGDFVLPDDAARVLGPKHPRLEEVTRDLIALCHHPRAGTFVLSGWRLQGKPVTFPLEGGGHVGPGPEETGAFALLPQDAPVPQRKRRSLRPIQLRQIFLTMLERQPAAAPTARPTSGKRVVRLLTYNVHSCIGMDGRLSTRRVARVIAQSDADVVALQELDRHRPRTRRQDQARLIAEFLRMEHHFHPAMQLAGEHFGNAVLSRLPMRLVRAGPLPAPVGLRRIERRAAIWVEIDVRGSKLQLFNTHLGLLPGERLLQVQALMREWIADARDGSPLAVCGDMNALPSSLAYRRLAGRLGDAQKMVSGWQPRATWPARWPVGRIDHVFVSPGTRVTEVRVPDNEPARMASDHRPLLVTIEFPVPAGA
jgi:endonuclease/exonuclease/phosphatase family metal-dependent hydrolase